MPIEYKINSELRTVFTTAWGQLSISELPEYLKRLVADSQYESTFGVLVDASALEGVGLTPEAMRHFAESTRDTAQGLAGARVSIYAPTDVIYGMMRMYQIIREEAPYEIQIFREMNEARRWLGLTPE